MPLPLGLLLLITLDLLDVVFLRHEAISWEGLTAVLLCVLLAACGWLERHRGGLERWRIPEAIWRVDRFTDDED